MSLNPAPSFHTHRHTKSATSAAPVTTVSQPAMDPYQVNLKAYANNSQSDLDSLPPPTTPPRTPQKTGHDAAAGSSRARIGSESASKPKSKGKNRQKNMTASPMNSRKSTPSSMGMQSIGISTSTKPISTPTNAYAGPTFHASPAPSALPIPSFFSKSVPESPGTKRAMISDKYDSTSSSDNSPTLRAAQISPPLTQREESPLDLFFKADREEKARARSVSLLRGTAPGPVSFSPPSDSPQYNSEASASTKRGHNRATHFIGGSSSAMFAMELDGTNSPGKPYGPAFSMPYNERINAARSGITSTLPHQTNLDQISSKDRSEALKAYLFLGQTPSPSQRRSSASLDVFLGTSCPAPMTSAAHSQDVGLANTGIHQSRQQSSPLRIGSIASQLSPRQASRSSGLRQEVSPATTPYQTPERIGYSYLTSATPLRPHQRKASSISSAVENNFGSNHSTAYTSCSTSGTRITDLKGMEDSLRRLLKIEPVGDSGVHSGRLGNMPATVVSVTNYIGGQPSPINEIPRSVIGS